MLAYLLDTMRVELLHELLPDATIFAILVNPTSGQAEVHVTISRRQPALSDENRLCSMQVSIDTAFATLVQQRANLLVVSADPFFLSKREQIIALAAYHAVPAIYEWRTFAAAGGLMSYGV